MKFSIQAWWVLAYAWRPEAATGGQPSLRHARVVSPHRVPRCLRAPQTAAASTEFQRQLTEALAPIRCYGDPRNIYLA
jgi:hypothetical protein